MTGLRQFWMPAVLLGICLALGVALVQLQGPAADAARRPPVPVASLPALPEDVAVSPSVKSAYAVVAERPIFQPDRRPYVAAVVAPPPAPTQSPPPPPAIRAYTVVGVVVSANRRLAWLKAPSATSPARVSEGDVVQGWRVKQISADRVTFEAGTAEHVLELKRRAAGSPATAPGSRQ